jgi:hypothetical protein
MPTPSLLIVPARFKTGTLYSQIPVPVAPSTSSVGDFTVTRNTAARRFDSAGLVASVASGIPRLDYYTSGGVTGCPALLVEPSGTNLCLQSENFSTTWSPTNTVVSGNVAGTTDPAGGNTADQIFETATSGNHFLAQTMTIVSGTTYVGSVFYKKAAGSPDWMQVAFSTTGLAGFANFNLTSGTVGNVFAGATGRIENYGNGWYRCTLIQTASANGTSGGPIIVFTNNTNSITRFVSYTGNTATSIYAWGAQLETGSVATSYIPTTTGTGSRSADVISVSGAVSGSIGQTEGVLYIECESNNASDDVISINRNAANAVAIYKNANNSYLGRIYHSSTSIIFTSASGVTGTVKIAVAYKSGDSTMYINGSRVGTLDTTAITFGAALNTLAVNKATALYEGVKPSRIRAVALYSTRLTDAELATLTT